MSGGKRLSLLVLVLFLALLPVFSSEEEFLTELEKELVTLENSLIKLSMASQEQKSELTNLLNYQTELRNQLNESQEQVTELKNQSEKLKNQWDGLLTSLEKNEKELASLRLGNKLLIGGICVTLVVSVVAIVIVAIKT